MKAIKIMSLAVLVVGSFIVVTIQDVPEKVKKAFANQYPTVTSVHWEKETKTEWEADFMMENVKYSANYREDGTWQETEYEIDDKDVPQTVRKALMKAFPGYKIDEAEKLETHNGVAFEIEMEKGVDEMEIVIDIHGKILKKEMENEDDE